MEMSVLSNAFPLIKFPTALSCKQFHLFQFLVVHAALPTRVFLAPGLSPSTVSSPVVPAVVFSAGCLPPPRPKAGAGLSLSELGCQITTFRDHLGGRLADNPRLHTLYTAYPFVPQVYTLSACVHVRPYNRRQHHLHTLSSCTGLNSLYWLSMFVNLHNCSSPIII